MILGPNNEAVGGLSHLRRIIVILPVEWNSICGNKTKCDKLETPQLKSKLRKFSFGY